MDGFAGMYQFKEQPVSMFDLPDFARDDLGNELRLGKGVGQIESLIARSAGQTVQLGDVMAADLTVLMSLNSRRQVLQLHWAVHPSALEGVLDQVRTRLIQLVGELRATMPRGQHDPTPTQVAQALQNINIVTGDNSSVTVTAPVAVAHRRGSARAEIAGGPQQTFPQQLHGQSRSPSWRLLPPPLGACGSDPSRPTRAHPGHRGAFGRTWQAPSCARVDDGVRDAWG